MLNVVVCFWIQMFCNSSLSLSETVTIHQMAFIVVFFMFTMILTITFFIYRWAAPAHVTSIKSKLQNSNQHTSHESQWLSEAVSLKCRIHQIIVSTKTGGKLFEFRNLDLKARCLSQLLCRYGGRQVQTRYSANVPVLTKKHLHQLDNTCSI